jgi:hypothetical protein
MLSLNVLRRWPLRLALAGASAVCGPALAQSAYSITVLGKPSGAFSFAPTTLDDQGVVRGGMYSAAGLKFVVGAGAFGFLPAYLTQAVSWSGATATTTATTAATLGGKYPFPRLSNNSGLQLGPYSKATEFQNTLMPEVYPSSAATFQGANVYASLVGSTALLTKRLGASNTSSAKSMFVAKGMNNAGAIAGLFIRPVSVSGEVTNVKTPLVLLNGHYTTLDINDTGTVLGQVSSWPRWEATTSRTMSPWGSTRRGRSCWWTWHKSCRPKA